MLLVLAAYPMESTIYESYYDTFLSNSGNGLIQQRPATNRDMTYWQGEARRQQNQCILPSNRAFFVPMF